MRALPLALCCCLLLAGCSALTGPAAPTGTTTPAEPTVTPAPVPETAPTVLPGVGDDGENETGRFRAVNHEALGNTSLRSRTVYQLETTSDGDPIARAITVRRVENATTMRLDFEQYRPDMAEFAIRDAELWVGPDRAFRRLELNSGSPDTERRPSERAVRQTIRPDVEPIVETLLSTPLRPDDQYTVDGETWYVLTGERDTLPEFVEVVYTESNRDVRVTARVDEAGVIRSFGVEWRGEYDGETVRAQYVVRFEQFGEATAPKPAWVDRFVDATPTP